MADIAQMNRHVFVYINDGDVQYNLLRKTFLKCAVILITNDHLRHKGCTLSCISMPSKIFRERCPIGAKVTFRDFLFRKFDVRRRKFDEVIQIKNKLNELIQLFGF